QRLDDPLEVALHRVGLATKLVTVRVGEARARLGLELVAGQVLGFERQGLGEISIEIGGALPWNPVDEVQRDVFKTGITKKVYRAADVVRTGAALEHREQMGLEALGTE